MRTRDSSPRRRSCSGFVQNRLTIPRPEGYPEEAYLAAFRDTLAVLEKWLEESG